MRFADSGLAAQYNASLGWDLCDFLGNPGLKLHLCDLCAFAPLREIAPFPGRIFGEEQFPQRRKVAKVAK
jgi:hypothetical protein